MMKTKLFAAALGAAGALLISMPAHAATPGSGIGAGFDGVVAAESDVVAVHSRKRRHRHRGYRQRNYWPYSYGYDSYSPYRQNYGYGYNNGRGYGYGYGGNFNGYGGYRSRGGHGVPYDWYSRH